MTLQPGDKLGPYEIVAPIGKGGMGEVYRAHDSRLNRDVAVKVSSAQFSERFTREARAIAALNHTNICHLYNVGPDYLVMEYVEGQDLRGPMDFEDALPIIQQLIDGIEAAHEKNIIHRDLKPANIKITPEGVVKILDFGLAKAMEPPSDNSNPENSPTLTMGATVAGTILGTAAYMAPEQAKGKAADKRSDIWSFGVIVYEMLTGKHLFQGESAVEILGGVLNQEPNIAAAPVRVHKLLYWCLEKDRKKRLASISDARRLMEESETAMVITAAPKSRLGLAAWAAVGLFLLTTLAVSFVHLREAPPFAPSLRYQISTPGSATAQFPALSPDGRNLAFVTSNGGPNQVWVRALDALDARPLAGTDGATYPFWSPDGVYLGFFAGGKLKKIAIAGGPPQTLCDASSGRGGAWNREGVILFSPSPVGVFLRVPASGGTPVPVAKVVENAGAQGYRFPVFLPDGVHFLYRASSDKPESSGVFVGSLAGGAAVRLLPDSSYALYAPPAAPGAAGHLLFRRESTLMAQPFDAPHLKTTGDIFPIAEQVAGGPNIGSGAFSVSENGMLVYRPADAVPGSELVWRDRAGKRLGAAVGKPGRFAEMALSPDEKTVAVTARDGSQGDIWLEEMGRGVLSRFTFRSGVNRIPIWSPEGSRIVFAFQSLSSGGGSADIYQKPAGGNGQEELLLHGGIDAFPDDWSPDGKLLVYEQTGQNTAVDLWLVPLSGDRKPVPYLQTPFNEIGARFSPDGRWLAYQSNESGQFQVYVQTVPLSGAKYQISTSGGNSPHWRRDGKELFYVSGDQKLMAVPVKLGATVEAGTPQPLFPVSAFQSYVSANFYYAPVRDGQRFLVMEPVRGEAAVAPPFTVVTNWQAAFKK
jgi:Tol biopolymer transport system component/predicted Ser/Thr protein kinase